MLQMHLDESLIARVHGDLTLLPLAPSSIALHRVARADEHDPAMRGAAARRRSDHAATA
ncbi:hypothetical protein [Sorangium cellulosum]|uniref:hypothetical protein n=1 Tax=Sorangium cellulosum TaxID=56 RepID=UPI001651A777|nr:hypothetical protein [Sorangium cellulosum]